MNDIGTQPKAQHLVFVHGGGVGPWMWRQQAKFFEGDFQVHTPTLPGHSPDGADTYTTHARAAQSIANQINLDALDGGVTVIGFSAGGQVSMELAAAYPEHITGTVVVSSLVHPWRAASTLAAVSAAAAPLARFRSFARAQAKQLYIPDADFESYFALSRSMSKSTLRNVMNSNFSFRVPPEFARSTHPSLLLAGAKEPRKVTLDLSRLSDQLPNSRFEIVTGVAHGIPLAKADHFNGLLLSWMESRKSSDLV